MNEENFIDSLRGLEGIKIGLYLTDNQYVEGTLLNVQEDHLTVKVLENTFYFPINQIKAIGKNAKDSQLLVQSENDAPMDGEQLEEILNNMRMQWITINSFNNQSFTGVLYRMSDDYVLLLNGEQQYFVRKEHITNIFRGFINMNQENHSNQGSNEQQNELNENENIELSTEEQNDASLNSENPQNDETETAFSSNNSPSEENQELVSEKSNESIQLKEVRFNSPMGGCTWNTNKTKFLGSIVDDESLNEYQNVQEEKSANQMAFGQTMNSEELSEVDSLELQETNDQNLELSINNQNVEPLNEELSEQNQEEPVPIMTMEDNIKLIEKQYYALMRFAESMNSLENQYNALMKHAEKMYKKIKNKRKL